MWQFVELITVCIVSINYLTSCIWLPDVNACKLIDTDRDCIEK